MVKEVRGWDVGEEGMEEGVGYRHTYLTNQNLSQPLTCVNEIYKHAGKEFTKEIEACMKAHMDNNKKGKHGKAVYSLDKFQLSEKMIEEEVRDSEERSDELEMR